VAVGERPTSFSQSLERGLAILATFQPAQPLLGISELARALDLKRSTTHRYVGTLAALGYLEHDGQTRKYRLGPRVLDLGFSAINSMQLPELARPHLQHLSDETGLTVNMAILAGTEIVYVERVRSSRRGQSEIDLNLHVGSRLPAYCTSMGKVLLAFLPDDARAAVLDATDLVRRGPNTVTQRRRLEAELARVRASGVAVNNEELAYGLRSIAVPVRARSGEVEAAINIAVHRTMVSLETLTQRLAPALERAARAISDKAGYRDGSTV
jgi:IclR family transcriptional regulator, pca regulon regulatory protein